MEDTYRSELDQLKRDYEQIRQRVHGYGEWLAEFEKRLNARPVAPVPVVAPVETPKLAPAPAPAQVPPLLPPTIQPVAKALVPLSVPAVAVQQPKPVETIAAAAAAAKAAVPKLPVAPLATPTSTVPPSARPEPESFEMKLGTYWLVRIGVVMMLTALAFFGYYAYQHYIPHLGPGGKLALMYVASGALLGFGAWQQRQNATEALKKFGEVLFAGGLAGVYFVTYAAHHIEYLRVIQSGLLDGCLLFAWVSFIVWLADKKKSETLGFFAVALAYYTSFITRIGMFTLYSNIVLTTAAVFFLVRNRWVALSFWSMVASYFGYAYWRFFHGEWAMLTGHGPVESLWLGVACLAGYWVIFTAAVFLAKRDRMETEHRNFFLLLNNSAFFSLVIFTLFNLHQGSFWKFSLGFGSVLIGLAWMAREVFHDEPLIRNSYLTQGLLLVTVGFITKFSGLQLALILATESVMLHITGTAQRNPLLQAAALLSAALAFGVGTFKFLTSEVDLSLGIGLGVLFLFEAVWSRVHSEEAEEAFFEPSATYFSLLAQLTWLMLTWEKTSAETLPLWLAGEALAFTFSLYVLRLRELTVLGQGFLLLAQLVWVHHKVQGEIVPPWWNPALIIAATLLISHWWQHQKAMPKAKDLGTALQGLFSLAVVGILFFWMQPNFQPADWLVMTSALAIGITVYGIVTRAWFLATTGQLFLIASCIQYVQLLIDGKPIWYLPLAPLATLLVLASSVVWAVNRTGALSKDAATVLGGFAAGYRWTALGLSLLWLHDYVPAADRCWIEMVLGAGFFLWAGFKGPRQMFIAGAIYTMFGLGIFLLHTITGKTVYVADALAILLLFAQQQIARRCDDRFKLEEQAHTFLIAIGSVGLWIYISRWMWVREENFYLTASWAVLALVIFIFGFVVRERAQRWSGLAVLGCALGRAVIVDVWRLETIYRILSFFALSVVLLSLGFIYTKYQDKIREWL